MYILEFNCERMSMSLDILYNELCKNVIDIQICCGLSHLLIN